MRRQTFLSFVIGSSFAMAPEAAQAQPLTTEGGFVFDMSSYDGDVSDGGGRDAYDGCYYLQVGGSDYFASGSTTMSLGGRQIEFPETSMSGLNVKRLIYVP